MTNGYYIILSINVMIIWYNTGKAKDSFIYRKLAHKSNQICKYKYYDVIISSVRISLVHQTLNMVEIYLSEDLY